MRNFTCLKSEIASSFNLSPMKMIPQTNIFVEPSFIQYTELTQEVLEVTDKILYQD